ncbi:MAG: hypothetical protein AB7S26_02795 [Sandaracinaceae bacterium]
MRRALKNVGGPTKTRGEPRAAEVAKRAWEAAAAEDADVLTHGFHSWPARMHYAIAREILASAKGANSVLDPFCGGGTVLVEARVADKVSYGIDLSPLAVRLAEVRSDPRDAARRARFVRAAEAVAEASEARVRGRVPIRVDLPPAEVARYSPHVLKELGGLREEIRGWAEPEDRRPLALVLSSILVKVSRQRADTSDREVERRIRKGLSTELFLRKAHELAARWEALEEVARGPLPEITEGDALRAGLTLGRRRVDLILTSPPYGGTYDYADHHARRVAFLELDDRKLRRFELGSRRALGDRHDAARVWDRQVDAMLEEMERVLSESGRIALVMGDAKLGRDVVRADEQLERLAPQHGLGVDAIASQPRTDWQGGEDRAEHIILLSRRDPIRGRPSWASRRGRRPTSR